jgi:hypothetical protein
MTRSWSASAIVACSLLAECSSPARGRPRRLDGRREPSVHRTAFLIYVGGHVAFPAFHSAQIGSVDSGSLPAAAGPGLVRARALDLPPTWSEPSNAQRDYRAERGDGLTVNGRITDDPA